MDIGSVSYVCTQLCIKYVCTFVHLLTVCHLQQPHFSFAFQDHKVKVKVAIKNHCHHYSAFIYIPNLKKHHASIGYDNTSSKFAFQNDRVEVKVAVVMFRKKTLSSLGTDHLWTEFY